MDLLVEGLDYLVSVTKQLLMTAKTLLMTAKELHQGTTNDQATAKDVVR